MVSLPTTCNICRCSMTPSVTAKPLSIKARTTPMVSQLVRIHISHSIGVYRNVLGRAVLLGGLPQPPKKSEGVIPQLSPPLHNMRQCITDLSSKASEMGSEVEV